MKSGAGKKYMFWNSDFFRETVQKALLSKVGLAGSLTLFKGDVDAHSDYAMQVCNERLLLVQHKKDGRDIYSWKSKEPHDILDSTAQAFAVAASQGISGTNMRGRMPSNGVLKRKHKPRVKII